MIIIKMANSAVILPENSELLLKTDSVNYSVEEGKTVIKNDGDYYIERLILETAQRKYYFCLSEESAECLYDFFEAEIESQAELPVITVDVVNYMDMNGIEERTIWVETDEETIWKKLASDLLY